MAASWFSILVMLQMSSIACSLRNLLVDKKAKSYGPFLLSSSPTIAEIISGIGYDHVVVDMEHSPLAIEGTLQMLRAIRGPTTPVVRLPSHENVALTKQVLDILSKPAGLLFPMVDTPQQAQLAVQSTRYPPEGIRGCAHPFVRASDYGNDEDYFEKTCKDLFVMVQVESKEAVSSIAEIAQVDGVDGIFIGPFDLSCSMGQMGQFEPDGDVMKLIQDAEQEIIKHNQVLCGFQTPGRSLDEMWRVGYQFLSGSADITLLQKAAREDLKNAKKMP